MDEATGQPIQYTRCPTSSRPPLGPIRDVDLMRCHHNCLPSSVPCLSPFANSASPVTFNRQSLMPSVCRCTFITASLVSTRCPSLRLLRAFATTENTPLTTASATVAHAPTSEIVTESVIIPFPEVSGMDNRLLPDNRPQLVWLLGVSQQTEFLLHGPLAFSLDRQ